MFFHAHQKTCDNNKNNQQNIEINYKKHLFLENVELKTHIFLKNNIKSLEKMSNQQRADNLYL